MVVFCLKSKWSKPNVLLNQHLVVVVDDDDDEVDIDVYLSALLTKK